MPRGTGQEPRGGESNPYRTGLRSLIHVAGVSLSKCLARLAEVPGRLAQWAVAGFRRRGSPARNDTERRIRSAWQNGRLRAQPSHLGLQNRTSGPTDLPTSSVNLSQGACFWLCCKDQGSSDSLQLLQRRARGGVHNHKRTIWSLRCPVGRGNGTPLPQFPPKRFPRAQGKNRRSNSLCSPNSVREFAARRRRDLGADGAQLTVRVAAAT